MVLFYVIIACFNEKFILKKNSIARYSKLNITRKNENRLNYWNKISP